MNDTTISNLEREIQDLENDLHIKSKALDVLKTNRSVNVAEKLYKLGVLSKMRVTIPHCFHINLPKTKFDEINPAHFYIFAD